MTTKIIEKEHELDDKAIKDWLIKTWGKRCKSFESGCGLCNAWKCFDFLTHPDKHDAPYQTIAELKAENRRLRMCKDLIKLVMKGTLPLANKHLLKEIMEHTFFVGRESAFKLFEEEFKHGSNGFDSKEAKEIIQKLRAKAGNEHDT
jgi:hypothetical protein